MRSVPLLLLSMLLFGSCNTTRRTVRFGVLTDIHYAERDPLNDRYYAQAMDKTREAIDVFRQHPLDFVVELGDLKDQSSDADKTKTLNYLNRIEQSLQNCGKPVYHVLGNHDTDCISKQEFFSQITNPPAGKDKGFYSFRTKGVKFIVLDANFNPDQSDYDSGNFDWTKALIPDHELQWLEKELKKGDEPVIVFIHQLLDAGSGLDSGLYVSNAATVQQILVRSGRVLAVFQGHHHGGHYSHKEGIHYCTMPGVITGAHPDSNAYAIVEVAPDGTVTIHGYRNCPSRTLLPPSQR